MKHFRNFDNIFQTEAWYFWGNRKVLLGHLDWGLGAEDPQSDPADKTCLGLHTVSNVSKWSNLLLKNGVKTSVTGSCTTDKEILQSSRLEFLNKKQPSKSFLLSNAEVLSYLKSYWIRWTSICWASILFKTKLIFLSWIFFCLFGYY